jgi:hypothetical protein
VFSLPDRVEAEVARAKRTFRQSRNIVAAARHELENYGRWLDPHRVTSAEESKTDPHLFNRKMAVNGITQFAVAPFALAQALRLRFKEGLLGTSSLLSFAETASHFVVFALGFITIFLVAAGTSRATRSSPPARAPVLAVSKVPDSGQPAIASATVPKIPGRAKRPTLVAGFTVHPQASTFDPLLLPAPTVAEMMLITSPLALASKGPETATVPIAPLATRSAHAATASTAEPSLAARPAKAENASASMTEHSFATRPAVKAKPRRKLSAPEPQEFPWWQRWSWIRVR